MIDIKIERLSDAVKLALDSGFTFCVDDNGHSHHKVAVIRNRTWKLGKYQSMITSGAVFSSEAGASDCYEVDGNKYTCSPALDSSDDLTGSDYQQSDRNLALICSGLHKSKITPKDQLILGTTMPVSQYYRANEINVESVRAFQNRLETPNLMRVSGDSDFYQVLVSKVFCESFCAFYDFLITDDFMLRTGLSSSVQGGDVPPLPIAIVDVGGRTTDVVTIINMKAVDQSRSKTVPLGILTLYDKVEELLRKFLKDRDARLVSDDYNPIPRAIINSVLSGDTSTVSGHSLEPLKNQIEELKEEFSSTLVEAVDKVLRNRISYGHIVFAGGGAVLLESQLKRGAPGSVFHDEFANAKGALKLMLVYLGEQLVKLAEGKAAQRTALSVASHAEGS